MLDLLISSKFDGHMSKRIINMTVERSSVVLDFLYNVWYNVIVHICTYTIVTVISKAPPGGI